MPRQSLGSIVEFTTYGCFEATLVLCVVDLGLSLGVEGFGGGFHGVHFSHLDSRQRNGQFGYSRGQGYSIIKQQYDAGVASPLPRDGLVLNCNMISNAYFAIRISNGSMSRLPHALLCSKGYRNRSVNRRKKQDYGKVE